MVCIYVCANVYVSICRSASISPKLRSNLHLIFLFMLPLAAARFSSEGVAIRYVLPVLWMTSCLHIMARKRRRAKSIYSRWFNRKQQDLTPRWIHEYSNWSTRGKHRTGLESAVFDCPGPDLRGGGPHQHRASHQSVHILFDWLLYCYIEFCY